jgi:hypothetical protein
MPMAVLGLARGGRRRTFVPGAQVSGQRLDGRVVEQRHHGDGPAEGRLQATVDLDQEQRVAAQVEEVVLHPYGVETEHFPDDLGDRLLGTRLRRPRGHAHLLRAVFDPRKGAAVDLAVRRQGDPFEDGEARRHHVAGQPLQQIRPQVGGRRAGRVRLGHHVAHQAIAARAAAAAGLEQHHRLADAGRLGESRLHLAQLDAEAPDLDLVVGAAEEDHLTVGGVAAQVAGAVEPIPGLAAERAERVGHEAATGELVVVHVPEGQVRAAHAHLPHLAHGAQATGPAQDQELDVLHAPAQGQHPPAPLVGRPVGGRPRRHLVEAHRPLRLRRAVEVDAGDARSELAEALDVSHRQDVAHQEHAAQGLGPDLRASRGTGGRPLGDHLGHGRREQGRRHPLPAEPAGEPAGRPHLEGVGHHHRGPQPDRREEIPVEGVVGEAREH